MLHTIPMTLVTIVAEEVLEAPLLLLVERLGATGHTVTESHGKGSRGSHTGAIPGANIRIEVLVTAATAEAIMELLAAEYFDSYAVIAWVTAVGVLRGEKYVR